MTEFQLKIKLHEELIKDFKNAALEAGDIALNNGFQDFAFSNDKYDKIIKDLLIDPERTANPNVVYLRGRPDLFVLTRNKQDYFVDAKTLDNYRPPANGSNIPNLSIEMTSYAVSYNMAKAGIRTLIIIRYPEPYNINKGFWLTDGSRKRYRPDKILIPSNAAEEKRKTHLKMAEAFFAEHDYPTIPSMELPNCKSDSGDLFILLYANQINHMLDWHEMVSQKR